MTCVYELLLLLRNKRNMFKVNDKDARTVNGLCTQLILKTAEIYRPHCRPSTVTSFEQSVNLCKVPYWSSDFVVILEHR